MTQRKRNVKREIEADAKAQEKERLMDDAERKKREGINHFLYDKSAEAHRERAARRAEVMAAGGTHAPGKDGLTDEQIAAMFPNGGYSVKVVKPVDILADKEDLRTAVRNTTNRVRLEVNANGGITYKATFNNPGEDRVRRRRDGLRDPESGSSRFVRRGR